MLSFVCPTFLSIIVITLIQHTISYGCFFITSSGHFLCNFLLSTCNFHHIIIIIMQPAFVLLRTFPFTNIQTTIFLIYLSFFQHSLTSFYSFFFLSFKIRTSGFPSELPLILPSNFFHHFPILYL
ncbi:hypothetical protein GDO81_025578 [Engystomops pustulosus]|uniref:Uncharacterized protein n=1 Tax=Engystomops pustulosus TaxID=76066 RepID=A0AAV6YS48_ENGPU|nr:hypothetical protein GDO81_025578 [Engystomops pustulosus]